MKKIVSLTWALLFVACAGFAQTTSNVKTIGNVDNTKLLQTISDNYKGKVVVMDFWATWCGPCLAAMKSIKPIKEKYATNKDVVFLYITGETSPEANWKAMIPTISGDHYRLTKAQWSYLIQDLNMPGIPAYMILKKDGSIGYSNVTSGGYPGSETIEAEIEKALR